MLSQQTPCSHTLADSFSLLALFSTLASFVFNILRTLCAKHRGWGYLCDISALSASQRYHSPFFVAPLFSWSYKLLFPQVFYFDNYLRCPPGVGSALLSELCVLCALRGKSGSAIFLFPNRVLSCSPARGIFADRRRSASRQSAATRDHTSRSSRHAGGIVM